MVVSTGAAFLSRFGINFTMTDLIKTQIFESLVMLGCGMVIAILYSFFTRHICFYIKNIPVYTVCELLFWSFAATVTCRFLFYCAYGELSVHVISAFICGVFLWKLLFYATISVGDGRCSNKIKKEAESLKIQTK